MTLTPEQFNKLVTKDYLEEKIKDLATKDDINRVLDAVDSLAHKHTKFDQEMGMNQSAHNRFEKRITKLEAASV